MRYCHCTWRFGLYDTHLRTFEFSAASVCFPSENCRVTWAGLGSSLWQWKAQWQRAVVAPLPKNENNPLPRSRLLKVFHFVLSQHDYCGPISTPLAKLQQPLTERQGPFRFSLFIQSFTLQSLVRQTVKYCSASSEQLRTSSVCSHLIRSSFTAAQSDSSCVRITRSPAERPLSFSLRRDTARQRPVCTASPVAGRQMAIFIFLA